MKGRMAVLAVTLSVGTYFASEWWERGFATYWHSFDSPDGCLRIDTYHPFWVLPSLLHSRPHFDGSTEQRRGVKWEAPMFNRVYEGSTGRLLGESIIFDGAYTIYGTHWGDPKAVGRRVVTTGAFPVAITDRCADPVTLARLKAAYDRGEWKGGRSYRIDENGMWAGSNAYRLDGKPVE